MKTELDSFPSSSDETGTWFFFFFCICVLLVGLGFFLFLSQITCFLCDSGMGSSALLGGSRRSSVCIGFGDVFVRPPLIFWYSAHALQLFQSLLCFGCQKYMKLQKVFLMLTCKVKNGCFVVGFFLPVSFFFKHLSGISRYFHYVIAKPCAPFSFSECLPVIWGNFQIAPDHP